MLKFLYFHFLFYHFYLFVFEINFTGLLMNMSGVLSINIDLMVAIFGRLRLICLTVEVSSNIDVRFWQELLGQIASVLKQQAERLHMAALVTNQVTTRVRSADEDAGAADDGGGAGSATAALGVKWAHCVNTRLVLEGATESSMMPAWGDSDRGGAASGGGLEFGGTVGAKHRQMYAQKTNASTPPTAPLNPPRMFGGVASPKAM